MARVKAKHLPRKGELDPAQAVGPIDGLGQGLAAVAKAGPLDAPLGGGFGLSIGDLVQAGVKLATNPKGFLLDAVGELASSIGGFVGDVADFLDKWGDLIHAGWDLLKQIPGIGHHLAGIEQLASNFLDTLWYRLNGEVADPNDPGVGNLSCPGQTPIFKGTIDQVWWLTEVQTGEEIALDIKHLIASTMPYMTWCSDDAPPVSWGSFFERCHPQALVGGKWQVDHQWAANPRFQSEAPPYVRAWKISTRRILVMVGAMRAISFLPCTNADSGMVFEHEGDGENFYYHLEVMPPGPGVGRGCSPRPRLDVRLTGVICKGHSQEFFYGWDKLPIEDGRVCMNTARGAHPTSVAKGRMLAGTSFKNQLNSDWFPARGDPNTRTTTSHRIETEGEVLRRIYSPDGEWWGTKAAFPTKVYKSWGTGWDLKDGALTNIQSRIPLLSSEQNKAKCKIGPGCPTCLPTVSTAEQMGAPGDHLGLAETDDEATNALYNRIRMCDLLSARGADHPQGCACETQTSPKGPLYQTTSD